MERDNIVKKESPTILLIESSTDFGSVALLKGEKVVEEVILKEERGHASQISVITKELLNLTGYSVEELDGVAVSIGPGSYTGLRVGLSFAKGVAYGVGCKLISVPTLESTATMGLEKFGEVEKSLLIVPMIDARRMEVYTTLYNRELKRLAEMEALILDEESFSTQLSEGSVLFCGDGVEKFSSIVESDNAHFITDAPTAKDLARGAYRRYCKGEFEDVAYLEPLYLKEFIPGKPKRDPLLRG